MCWQVCDTGWLLTAGQKRQLSGATAANEKDKHGPEPHRMPGCGSCHAAPVILLQRNPAEAVYGSRVEAAAQPITIMLYDFVQDQPLVAAAHWQSTRFKLGPPRALPARLAFLHLCICARMCAAPSVPLSLRCSIWQALYALILVPEAATNIQVGKNIRDKLAKHKLWARCRLTPAHDSGKDSDKEGSASHSCGRCDSCYLQERRRSPEAPAYKSDRSMSVCEDCYMQTLSYVQSTNVYRLWIVEAGIRSVPIYKVFPATHTG